jgi:hypothetical protein
MEKIDTTVMGMEELLIGLRNEAILWTKGFGNPVEEKLSRFRTAILLAEIKRRDEALYELLMAMYRGKDVDLTVLSDIDKPATMPNTKEMGLEELLRGVVDESALETKGFKSPEEQILSRVRLANLLDEIKTRNEVVYDGLMSAYRGFEEVE